MAEILAMIDFRDLTMTGVIVLLMIRYHNVFRIAQGVVQTLFDGLITVGTSIGEQNMDHYWEKVKERKLYSRESKKCDLCDAEKNEILDRMVEDSSTVINTRNEFMRPCTHKYKELLSDQTIKHSMNDPLYHPEDIMVSDHQDYNISSLKSIIAKELTI